jgi:hypothetical protein
MKYQDSTYLAELLHANPTIAIAYIARESNPPTLVIHDTRPNPDLSIALPFPLARIRTQIKHTPPLQILRCPVTQIEATNDHQKCQDEPIKLGTQIQPENANWLGTAGSPVKWLGGAGVPHWGILSNWHVLADGDPRVGRTCHQPTAARPACARLSAWSGPNQGAAVLVDAAIADTFIAGSHTISSEILGLGPIGTTAIDASVGLPVAKSGRTTAVTRGRCTAIGAAVRVGYGDFDAVLNDQDIYAADSGEFSAAGDSGSLIVDVKWNRPVSLLFAGGGGLTIGNPMRHVIKAFNLLFPFA